MSMAELIDADDLSMLATGFEAAMVAAPGAGEADRALFELGWGEVLAASPSQAAATAFTVLGATGSAASLLDDVVAAALGLEASPERCMVFPAPNTSAAPARHGDVVAIDGLVSGRIDTATTAVVAFDDGTIASVDAGPVRPPEADALDPGGAYRRARVELDRALLDPLAVSGDWSAAVPTARVALAHQLLGGARTMLDQAREHAIDRVQFGRPVASFQAVRHKLAEAFVAIEGAAAVTEVSSGDVDPLVATLAKSLAGKAARTTATHAQQVLAGIGFTTDHPFHRWLKRTLVLDTLFGSSSTLPAEIGADLLRRGRAPRLVEL
jgi:alkylation response protein AidB-like acyl-CoA dehydrogenase